MRHPADTQERDPHDLFGTTRPLARSASLKPSVPKSKAYDTNRFNDLTPSDLSEPEKNAVTELALAVQASRVKRGEALTSPDQARDFLRLKYGDRHNELFGAIFLDNKNRILAVDEMFYGTINGTTVHPRVVVQRAFELKVCAAVLLFHNHPSTQSDISQADEVMTQRLQQALSLIDIRVIDHIIVTSVDSVSFAERGII